MSPVRVRSLLVVTGACFATLAVAVLLLGSLPADAAVREVLLASATPAVVEAMRLVNMGGEWPVLVPGTLLLFVVFPRARQHWWVWVLLMLTAPLAETGMKYLVGRPRPEDGSFGFPSGHATAAAAFFGAVGYLAGGLPASLRLVVRPAAGLAIVLVALARVILRAHWPSDAVAGVALGLALAAAAALVAATVRPPSPVR